MKKENNHYFINSNTKDLDISFDFILDDIKLKLISNSGVFSKNKIDFGTKLLIKNISHNNPKYILDLGCGYGIIGLYLAKKYIDAQVTMVDINEKAVKLSKMNIKNNLIKNASAFVSNGLDDIEITNKFNIIALNPPIKAGKAVMFKLIDDAAKNINNLSGKLFVVNKKNQGANSTLNYLLTKFKEVEIINKDKGYWIFQAKKAIN